MFPSKYYLFITLLVIFNSSTQSPVPSNEIQGCFAHSAEGGARVFLTISSLYVSTTEDGVVERQLEINWVGATPVKGDIISVYDHDPGLHGGRDPLVSVHPHKHPGGYYRSDVTIPVILLNMTHMERDHCLGYWVAYHNEQNETLSSSCLRIQPFWMDENRHYLSHLTLNQAMIPGSHDSGSFYYHKELGPLSKYMYAQEENLFSQMVYGLRYFDLRVGFYHRSRDKYYINHNFLRTEHSVQSVLNQVLKFIKATRKEVIILDFHNFPIGFNNNHTHEELMQMAVKTLGPHLVPYTQEFKNAPFSFLWKTNKRVLVSYGDDIRERYLSHFFWPSIPRAWGNKQQPDDLKSYFEEFFEKGPVPEGALWASMAELTPDIKTILLHPESGLRVLADVINRNVTHWFRDLYWHKANIVATDYFLGNDIIDVAIRANRLKGSCPPHFWPKLKI